VNTYDSSVVRNIINDLPLDYAFRLARPSSSTACAKPRTSPGPGAWQLTLMIVSDGDTVPTAACRSSQPHCAGGRDRRRRRRGWHVPDGHQSRQDAVTLRQLAQGSADLSRTNERHLAHPAEPLARIMALRDAAKKGRREAAGGGGRWCRSARAFAGGPRWPAARGTFGATLCRPGRSMDLVAADVSPPISPVERGSGPTHVGGYRCTIHGPDE
jgi:hypothetical protein